MKKIKKLVLSNIVVISLLLISSLSAFAKPIPSFSDTELEKENLTKIVLDDPNSIKNYVESNGEEYTSDLVEITIYKDPTLNVINPSIDVCDDVSALFEYELVNKHTSSFTDLTNLLKEYHYPSGSVTVTDSTEITNKVELSGKATAKAVEACVKYSTSEKKSFSISWTGKYMYDFKVMVYPVYEVTTGHLYERDVWHDDYLGFISAYRATGTEVRVYKQ